MYEVSLYTNRGEQFDFAAFRRLDSARKYAADNVGRYQAQIVNTETGNVTIFTVKNGELKLTQCYALN